MIPDLKGLFDLARDRDQKLYAWLRHIVLLASGALTVLVSLRAGSQSSGAALVFVRAAWISLGCGILLGAFSLHGEVWTAAELAKRMGRQITERSLHSDAPLAPVAVKLPARYRWSFRLCFVALVIAVVSLVSYAVTRN